MVSYAPPDTRPIGLREAERKYPQVSNPLLSQWVKAGKLVVLQRPSKGGEKLLIDERSLVEALKTFKPRKRKNGVVPKRRGRPPKDAAASRAPSPPPAPRPTPTPSPPPYPHPQPIEGSCPHCGGQLSLGVITIALG